MSNNKSVHRYYEVIGEEVTSASVLTMMKSIERQIQKKITIKEAIKVDGAIGIASWEYY